MKYSGSMPDKVAIGLSFLCMIHCLTLPLLLTLVPSIAALPLGDEAFHKWILIVIIPISVFALTMGCKQHKRYHIFFLGGLGLGIIILTAFLGHDFLGEVWEKILTVIGASIIALGHFVNYRLCRV